MARAWLLAPWGVQPMREPQPPGDSVHPLVLGSRAPFGLRSRLRAVEIPACVTLPPTCGRDSRVSLKNI